MRLFETSELVLVAVFANTLDLIASLRVVLVHVYGYVLPEPILALYATKAAVALKTAVGVALLMLFTLVKWFHALKTPRANKIVRTALYAYITFVLISNVVLAAVLESLSVPPIISQIPH
jgi:hypothetical protein